MSEVRVNSSARTKIAADQAIGAPRARAAREAARHPGSLAAVKKSLGQIGAPRETSLKLGLGGELVRVESGDQGPRFFQHCQASPLDVRLRVV